MSAIFGARFRGVCAECDGSIKVDQIITRGLDDAWVHVDASDCAIQVDMTPGKACTSCFLIHAPDQKECH